mmetsp:Transcript_80238/g.194484  ORF Transcript_80238/g.194484 Transcript_80238/m.194484 type:complete len:208 (+) Transcript_80238:433-1056(+)
MVDGGVLEDGALQAVGRVVVEPRHAGFVIDALVLLAADGLDLRPISHLRPSDRPRDGSDSDGGLSALLPLPKVVVLVVDLVVFHGELLLLLIDAVLQLQPGVTQRHRAMHPAAGRAARALGALRLVAVVVALVVVRQRKRRSPPAREDAVLQMQLLLEGVHVLRELTVPAIECALLAYHGGGGGAPVARLLRCAPCWRRLGVAAHLA